VHHRENFKSMSNCSSSHRNASVPGCIDPLCASSPAVGCALPASQGSKRTSVVLFSLAGWLRPLLSLADWLAGVSACRGLLPAPGLLAVAGLAVAALLTDGSEGPCAGP
jgi:hypothetical protein